MTGTGGAGARDGGAGGRDSGTDVNPGTGGGGGKGTGGTTGKDGGSGGVTGIDGGGGTEPCVPDKTVSMSSGSGSTGSFGTKEAFCFRTPDNIAGWNCSNLDGRTLKVNGTTATCSALPLPAKVNGYYYFDATAGTYDYASIQWW